MKKSVSLFHAFSLLGTLSRRAARYVAPAVLLCAAMGSASAQTSRMATADAAQSGTSTTGAAQASAVSIELTQAKVVTDASGKETLLDASTVKPGDVIEYRAVYTNRSGRAIKGLVATLPIPPHMEYVGKSAMPKGPQFQAATADGVAGAEPLMHTIAGKKIAVPYADYRELRWHLDRLDANAKANVSARAVVSSYAPAAASAQAAPTAPSLPLAPPAAGRPAK